MLPPLTSGRRSDAVVVDAIPMPPRRFELVGLELDLRRCYAAAGHLSELGWRLICVSRTLVSSEACPDVDVAVRITREGMTMAVHVSDHARMTMALRTGGERCPPLAGM